ncbi:MULTISPECIES: LirA/MavJ family T4SS effector [unclassified Pseudomonas]|uniref:LirA/MavJ family T4SS effector n=1 Tax=unclassified Pseudomonas TaxID=196821 RepID=UPI001F573451|nr:MULTISPECIES: LirA/MavJ family T4SS effector [unclassified Pseudomonas]
MPVPSEMNFVLTEKKPEKDRSRAAATPETDRADYDLIFDFLENKQKFEPALSRLSALMWSHYRMFTLQTDVTPGKAKPPGNLFTRALSLVAHQYQFTFQQGLVAETDFNTVPLSVKLTESDPYIGYLIRHKIFWKDVIATDHGEHSHSLQWLVLARELTGKTTSPIAELYARSVDYYSWVDKKFGINLWQLLVDCFPLDGGGARGDVLTTDTYRSPNNVTRHLLGYSKKLAPLKGHFISDYLSRRYKHRNWVVLKPNSGGAATVDFKKITAPELTPDWARGTTKFSEARLKRSAVAHDNPFSDRSKIAVNYHQAPGFIYMNEKTGGSE